MTTHSLAIVAAVVGAVLSLARAAPTPVVIDLLPAPPLNLSTYRNGSWTSWGGSVIHVPEDPAYAYHLYVAFFTEQCGLGSWTTNSEVVHAVSVSDPLGPYTYSDVAVEVFAHNPQVTRHTDGTFLLWTIGMSPQAPESNCTPKADGEGPAYTTTFRPPPLQHGAELVEQRWSKSPYGPWTPVTTADGSLNLFNGTNPSPFVLPNGTVVVASHNNCGLTLSSAANWTGPYSNPVCVVPYAQYPAISNYTFEDPFLWMDSASQTWRVLLHSYNKTNPHIQFGVGGYAQSLTSDPYGPWTLQDPSTPAYTTAVQFSDGSGETFSRRERPKLLFDATTGQPTALFTAVCPEPDGDQHCFTLGQNIGPGAF
jgi:hypothetical protein